MRIDCDTVRARTLNQYYIVNHLPELSKPAVFLPHALIIVIVLVLNQSFKEMVCFVPFHAKFCTGVVRNIDTQLSEK